MLAMKQRPPRNTGPLEARDYGPNGQRLGTFADCYEGSPWELHRGELVEQVGAKDIHSILMALITALFRTHARADLTVMTDVYCDLSDAEGESLRAPDVVLVEALGKGKDEVYRGKPILAVEVRATQSKRYLEEKVKLYLEHTWPCVWLVHAAREEIEVVTPGLASVTYRPGSRVPLPPELSKYGLREVPAAAFFDEALFAAHCDGWVKAEGRAEGKAEGKAEGILAVLAARSIAVPEAVQSAVLACADLGVLDRWMVAAATCASAEAFTAAMVAS